MIIDNIIEEMEKKSTVINKKKRVLFKDEVFMYGIGEDTLVYLLFYL
ncbi:MAG TPA: hypothetical protein VLA74_11650 [Nitrososphaeraceae archaeon]|nr:hypothetical protein [Nitrososphaeraceae archaeon]